MFDLYEQLQEDIQYEKEMLLKMMTNLNNQGKLNIVMQKRQNMLKNLLRRCNMDCAFQ